MKKETIITAVIFLVVGYLAGYITHAQLNWDLPQKTTAGDQSVKVDAPGRGGAPNSASEGTPPGLPAGHPPLEIAAQMRALESQANQSPSDAKPRLELANLLYDNHQYERAIEWYRKALELDPQNVNARTDLGTAYFYSGRPQDALREFRKSLETDPKHEPTLLNTIVVNVDGTHDLAAAQEAWDRLRNLNPRHPQLETLRQKLETARAAAAGVPTR